MNNINIESSENNNFSSGDKTINVSEPDKGHSLSARYHNSEIILYEVIIRNAIKMIWVGILMIFIGMIISMFVNGASKVLMILPGAFIDIFSGAMIHLVNKSSESKQKYFENLTIVEHEQRIIELIHKSDDQEFQQEMICKIVDRHCKG